MKVVYMFEAGEKIVIAKEKVGDRYNHQGDMDKHLGRTYLVDRVYVGSNPHYSLKPLKEEAQDELAEDVRKWNWFFEMIDVEATIEANKATIEANKAG